MYDRILITGARGMLASAINQQLTRHGRSATLTDRDELDITSENAVATAFDQLRPTLVINCAAHTNVDKCEKELDLANAINGTAVGHLAKHSARLGSTLVHVSTDYVFDGTLRRPLRADDPVGPVSAYGKSKLLGEQLLRQFAPSRWLILRTAWLYGVGGANFVQTMLNAARAGKPLSVIADQVGCPTHTVDFAVACLALLDTDAAGAWHIANAGQANWFEFTQAIMDEFGVTPASLQPISTDDWKKIKPDTADRPSYSVFDLTALEQKLGRPMTPWREALAAYRRLLQASDANAG